LPPNFRRAVVALGVFDGLHAAHMEIVQRIIRSAREEQACSMMITFDPHPRQVLNRSKDFHLPILSPPTEKMKILGNTDLDAVLFLEANREFLNLSEQSFVKDILGAEIRPRKVVVGYDYHFGKQRGGSPDLLKSMGPRYDFETEIVPPYKIDGSLVRSSVIRNLLQQGSVVEAARFLGRPYSFAGYVVTGASRGRTLGFPTANLSLHDSAKVIPGNGVYLVRVNLHDKLYSGLCYIGERSTFNERKRVIENHILDFPEADLYGEELEIQFIERVREDRKFESTEALKEQIQLDEKYCRDKIFKVKNKKYQMEDRLNDR